jgi:hypothetical protein
MNTQPRGLRLLCPQGCGTTLTISMPTLAEVDELPGDTSLKNLDALVGRNVVGALLVHCLYTCTAVSEGNPLMHLVGSQVPDIEDHDNVALVARHQPIPDGLCQTSAGRARRMN